MLIDSHCHLPHRRYEMPLEQLLQEAHAVGVSKFITIGTSLSENDLVVKTAEKFPEIYPTIAVYPHEDIAVSLEEISNSLNGKLQKPNKIVAIGECGLDISNWENGRELDSQKELFELQLSIALEHKLPVVVHNRNADEEVYRILKKFTDQGLTGVMHCFDSIWEYAQKVLDLGFYLSFSAMVTYPKKTDLYEVVKNVPLDRFLVETDAPYLAPQTMRGQVNYPKCVKIVAEKVAEIKQKAPSEVETFSFDNTCKLFKI